MRKKSIAFCLVLGVLGLAWANRAEPQQPNNVAKFMRAKLDHSEKVLEGLALEDFDMIAKHSQDISLLSLAANWQVLQTPEYLHQSAEFRKLTDDLTKAAKEKNLDGAALAYVGMTMKCVSCHKYVRGVRMAGNPPKLPRK
ncbi:MAG: hypothetical protein AB7O62_19265 [Pirellulales bacterium]